MSGPAVFAGPVRVAVPSGCALGEGGVWDERTQVLWFVDSPAGHLFRWTGAGDPERFDFDGPIGFALLTDDPDTIVIGRKRGPALFHAPSGDIRTICEPTAEPENNRLNDGHVGPDGSLFFGSMDDAESEPTGTFYRWAPDGVSAYGARAIVTNGPAADPVRQVLYAADSKNRTVFRHPLGADGSPGEAEIFCRFGEGDGQPDGMAVDTEHHLWVGHWGGSRITRFSPEGEPVLVVPIPTALVTKPCFGGPDLATLFCTTASVGRDRTLDPMAGHVFAFEAGVRGMETFRVPHRTP